MSADLISIPDGPAELSGSMDDFSLEELFELFTSTRASGVLSFAEPVGATLWIVDGSISYGTSLGNPAPRELLTRQGIVTEAQFDGAMSATPQGRSLKENLVDLFGADGDRIGAVAREQIITTAFEIVVVGSESFEFRSGDHDPLGVAIRLEHTEVLAEAERRREEWKRISTLIPSTGIITGLSPELPAGKSGLTITTDEWQVLAQLDGYRTIGDVISILGQSAFEVCEVLFDLLQAGTIRETGRTADDVPGQ